MRRRLAVLLAAAVVTGPLVVSAAAQPTLGLTDVSGLTAVVEGRAVGLDWAAGDSERDLQVLRDGAVVATLPAGSTSYDDASVRPGRTYGYRVATAKPGRVKDEPVVVPVTLPAYLVGAANRDVTPDDVANLGGFGLGDGRLVPGFAVSRGGRAASQGERIRARAMVVDDGTTAIAIANVEVTGHFAAYQDGKYGLEDMAELIAASNPRLPLGNILIAADHTHAGPDTLGAWGGSPQAYLEHLRASVVAAIEEAYAQRRFASLRAGESDASDLIYNQACTEALNQSKQPTYAGPEVCATPGKDGMFRVVQATAPGGEKVVTWATYAAHATAGGGHGLHGDWPQFLSDAMAAEYGGQGLAMVGALGGTQPCRPTCAFTKKDNPGYDIGDRKTALMANYTRHVRLALASGAEVTGPVAAQRGYIREPLVGPAVTALFTAGRAAGAELLRSRRTPWVNAQTIRTVVGAMRIGDIAIIGTPGEGFPRIGQDVRDAVAGERMVIQLGLAGDMLGYLIAPVEYVPIIAAEVPVNDNIIFNVSPTIGDHVACADLRLTLTLGFAGKASPRCLAYDLVDSTGDPIAAVPVGGVGAPAP